MVLNRLFRVFSTVCVSSDDNASKISFGSDEKSIGFFVRQSVQTKKYIKRLVNDEPDYQNII